MLTNVKIPTFVDILTFIISVFMSRCSVELTSGPGYEQFIYVLLLKKKTQYIDNTMNILFATSFKMSKTSHSLFTDPT